MSRPASTFLFACGALVAFAYAVFAQPLPGEAGRATAHWATAPLTAILILGVGVSLVAIAAVPRRKAR